MAEIGTSEGRRGWPAQGNVGQGLPSGISPQSRLSWHRPGSVSGSTGWFWQAKVADARQSHHFRGCFIEYSGRSGSPHLSPHVHACQRAPLLGCWARIWGFPSLPIGRYKKREIFPGWGNKQNLVILVAHSALLIHNFWSLGDNEVGKLYEQHY